MAQLFNFTGEQRVDTPDLTAATNSAILGFFDDLLGGVFLPPGSLKVVSGFAPSAQTASGPVQVGVVGTPNVALLAERTGALVSQPRLLVGGQATQAVDVSSFAAGTYTIYVRLSRQPGVGQNRVFWAALDQVEQARLTNTVLVADWELRLESALPGPEWFAIGQATITGQSGSQGVQVSVVDQRQTYFSGSIAAQGAPTWGTASDRSSALAGGLTDLWTTLDALKSSIADLKGRGLAAWTAPNPAGMQIGPGFGVGSQPVANQLQVGDQNFNINFNGGNPAIGLGPSDYFVFLRGTSTWERVSAQGTVYTLDAYGNAVFAGAGSFNQLASGHFNTLQATSQSPYGCMAGLYSAALGASSSLEFATSRGVNQALVIKATPGANASCAFITPITSNGLPNPISWLTATASGGLLSVSTTAANYNISGNTVSITGNPLVLNNRNYQPALNVWASGVYQQGTGITQFVGPSGATATGVVGNDNGGHQTILVTISGAQLPSTAILNVSGVYTEVNYVNQPQKAGKVYQTSWIIENSTQFRVACANAGNDPEDNGFSFIIITGS